MRIFQLRNLLKIALSSKGLSLSEVLIATGILAFAICGVILVYTLCSVLIATSRNINIASNAAIGLMEEIRSSTFSNIVNDYNGLTFTLNEIPESSGFVYVDDTNPELLEVVVSICWRQGERAIGEDVNLDGVLSADEDLNNNNIVDSPVHMVTRIANR
ncbi:MAG TPA: hypothetical protein PKO44_08220 [Candidatus Omnitrophota bacterium]|nr:hypothetical protein [Candidatus Omnitrophota bacterium]